MAEEVKMEPVAGAEPPKATSPLARPTLKLPPKTGVTGAFKPGLKLPPKTGMTGAFKPGLKLPTKPMKPMIRKPGATVIGKPLPKPTLPKPIEAAKPVEAPKPVEAEKPVEAAAPVEATNTVEAPVVADLTPVEPEKPMETLKSVTQKLKGITQQIPQQAILRKTGIIADEAMSESQKEAAKHKTARIALADAMGAAPVKDEKAPMKTIRIKRPIDIPGATKPLAPQTRPASMVTPPSAAAPAATNTEVTETKSEAAPATAEKSATTTASTASTITQRKTLKISRPGVVRPAGKFGLKAPSQASTVTKQPVDGSAAPAAEGAAPAEAAPVGEIADIPDISTNVPAISAPAPKPVSDGPAWLWAWSALVQAAACVAMAALAWFLYENTQVVYF